MIASDAFVKGERAPSSRARCAREKELGRRRQPISAVETNKLQNFDSLSIIDGQIDPAGETQDVGAAEATSDSIDDDRPP